MWTSDGYLSGNHINTIYDVATQSELYIAIGVGVLLIALILRRICRSRSQRAPDTARNDWRRVSALASAHRKPSDRLVVSMRCPETRWSLT